MNMLKTSYALVYTEVVEFWNQRALHQREAFEAIAGYLG